MACALYCLLPLAMVRTELGVHQLLCPVVVSVLNYERDAQSLRWAFRHNLIQADTDFHFLIRREAGHGLLRRAVCSTHPPYILTCILTYIILRLRYLRLCYAPMDLLTTHTVAQHTTNTPHAPPPHPWIPQSRCETSSTPLLDPRHPPWIMRLQRSQPTPPRPPSWTMGLRFG